MRFVANKFALVSLGLAASISVTSAQAQTTLEPLPLPPPVEPLNTTDVDASIRSRVELSEMPARAPATAPAKRATTQSAYYEVVPPTFAPPRPKVGSPASPIAESGVGVSSSASLPVAPSVGRDSPPTRSANTIVASSDNGSRALVALAPVHNAAPVGTLEGVPSKSPTATPTATGYAQLAPQTGLSVPASALLGAVRLGAATGGPSLREVVPSDVAEVVFTSASDVEPAAGWFTRTYRAALKRGGLLASKPEAARYELTAEVRSMVITPMSTGVHHRSIVTYRLRDVANGAAVWERTQTANLDVNRGFRFGAMGGALGAALGGAITGQNPAITSQMITNQRGHRPFDVRIDVYEGIMRGFQEMARSSVAELTSSSSVQ